MAMIRFLCIDLFFVGTRNPTLLIALIRILFRAQVSRSANSSAKVASFTGARNAVAVVNGTNALQVALLLAGVRAQDEVITQALTFVATCNAISYVGADPVFIDADKDTLGMSPAFLRNFLESHAVKKEGSVFNKSNGKRIKACLPMHTFGLPCRIQEISDVCHEWGIPLVEDAAESLGSFLREAAHWHFWPLGSNQLQWE